MAVAKEVEATVTVDEDGVHALVHDARAEVRGVFDSLDPAQHPALASEAWRIGFRAIQNAYAQADQARLQDVGAALLSDVDKQLKHHAAEQDQRIQTVLKSYFDPQSGQLEQRLRAFLADDGQLSHTLNAYMAEDGSVLARTLSERIGQQSPLFKLLNPSDADGVVQQLQKRFEEVIGKSHEALAGALDPAAEDGPVHRFLHQLRHELKANEADREKQLKTLTKELDANNPDSLLNNLNQQVGQGYATLLKQLNADDEKSAMAAVTRTLKRFIEHHMEENKELLEGAAKRQQEFEKEVRETLGRLEKQKEEAARSTHGGFEFEDAVQVFIEQAVAGGPYIAEATGGNTGLIRGSKVGDHVVRFTPEHAFAGCGLVLEAKRAANYTVTKVLEEMEQARKNRGCQAGVFVMARSHAPKGFPRFARYGPDVLVQWDQDDGTLDPYLHAAILCGLSLVTQTQTGGDVGELEALHDIEKRVRAEVGRLEKMDTYAGNIDRDAGKIKDEIRKGLKALDVLIRKGNQVLKALEVEVAGDEAQRSSPITLDGASLDRARDALGRDLATTDEARHASHTPRSTAADMNLPGSTAEDHIPAVQAIPHTTSQVRSPDAIAAFERSAPRATDATSGDGFTAWNAERASLGLEPGTRERYERQRRRRA